jgi:hypothetical protein
MYFTITKAISHFSTASQYFVGHDNGKKCTSKFTEASTIWSASDFSLICVELSFEQILMKGFVELPNLRSKINSTKINLNILILLLERTTGYGVWNHTKLFNWRRRFGMIWFPLQAVNLKFIYNINSSIIQHKRIRTYWSWLSIIKCKKLSLFCDINRESSSATLKMLLNRFIEIMQNIIKVTVEPLYIKLPRDRRKVSYRGVFIIKFHNFFWQIFF